MQQRSHTRGILAINLDFSTQSRLITPEGYFGAGVTIHYTLPVTSKIQMSNSQSTTNSLSITRNIQKHKNSLKGGLVWKISWMVCKNDHIRQMGRQFVDVWVFLPIVVQNWWRTICISIVGINFRIGIHECQTSVYLSVTWETSSVSSAHTEISQGWTRL